MITFRTLVVAGATWILCVACEGGGNGSDAGTGGGGPIVIQATERETAEARDTCGGCHVIVDEVRAGGPDADIVPDPRLYLDHLEMQLARDLGEP